MIKSGETKTLMTPVVIIPHKDTIIATITAYIDKKKTKEEAVSALASIQSQITKTG
jgi:hypothetical protein